MATAVKPIPRWNYRLVDLGLSTRWTDSNLLAPKDFLAGVYLPYGMNEIECNNNYIFNELYYNNSNGSKLLHSIEHTKKEKIISGTLNDPTFCFNEELRLPTSKEAWELINACNWAVVFQNEYPTPFRKMTQNGNIITTQINLKLVIFLQENYAYKEILYDCGDFDIIKEVEIRISGSSEYFLERTRYFDYRASHLIAYKGTKVENGIKFPFSGCMEYRGYIDDKKLKHDNLIWGGIESRSSWSVELPVGDYTSKGKHNQMYMLAYNIRFNRNDYHVLPYKPEIIKMIENYSGRNYRAVENKHLLL